MKLIKKIQKINEANLIVIERTRSKAGKWYNNVYYQVDKSEWKKPKETVSYGSQRKISAPPEENDNSPHRNYIPHKDTHNKDTHKNDNASDKKSFKLIRDFIPKTYEEDRCREIAKAVGEECINPLLSVLRKDGFFVIEKAWGLYREDVQRGKKIDKPAAYFFGIIKKVKEPRSSRNIGPPS